MKKLLVLLLLFAYAVSAIPQPIGRVNDFAGVLSAEEKAQLEQRLQVIEKNTSVEIAIVTIKSLDGKTEQQAALEYLENWGVGKKGKDNGIVIFAAIEDRKWKIEVGYGLEGTITDSIAGRIGRSNIVPYFKQQQYGVGLLHTVDTIAQLLNGEDIASSQGLQGVGLALVEFLYMIVIFFAVPCARIFNNTFLRRGIFFSILLPGFFFIIAGLPEMRLHLLLWMGFFTIWFFISEKDRPRKYQGRGIWLGGFTSGASGSGSFGGFGGGGGGGGGAGGSW